MKLMSTAEVARRLDLSIARVFQLATKGELRVAASTGKNWRLFDVADVERFAQERARQRAEREKTKIPA